VLLLTGSKEPPREETWHGRTAQGRSVTVYVVDGRPGRIRTSAIVTCPSNRYVQWINGPLPVRESWTRDYGNGWVGQGTSTLRLRSEDDAVSGTLGSIQRIAGPGRPYRCDSGSVSFSARVG
jgi:hypothetical protein